MRRNVAIIGAGIGAEHATGYTALPDQFRVHTICDLDQARATALAESHGAGVETDLTRVLADPAVEVVDICLPPGLHFEAASAALRAGKHVICEKPLVPSLAEADRLSDLARDTGRRVFPVFQYRFGPGAAQLRALIDAGLAGRPLVATLETHWNRGADYYAVPWRGTWAGEQGGAILGHAIHIHDWLRFALGPVASVHAELATRANQIEVEDCAALSIRMECGALVTSSVTLGAAEDTSRMRFCFAGLTAESGRSPYAPAADTWQFQARAPVTQRAVDACLAQVPDTMPGFAGFLQAVADALNGDDARAVTLADARASLEFVSAVYASARSGQRADLPLENDHPLYHGWIPTED